MASARDVDRAYDKGYESGRVETIQRLRAFTGVHPFEPDLDKPEHLAYPEYLAQLTQAHEVAVERAEHALERIRDLVDRIAAAEEKEQQILDQRREDRSAKNPLSRLGSRVGDLTLPVSKDIRALRKDLEVQEEWRTRCLDDAERYRSEASKVARWVDDCIAAAEQVQAQLRPA